MPICTPTHEHRPAGRRPVRSPPRSGPARTPRWWQDARPDRLHPVPLLGQQPAHQEMRPGRAGRATAVLCRVQHRGVQPLRPADEEAERPAASPGARPALQRLAGRAAPPRSHRHHQRRFGQRGQQRRGFPPADFAGAAARPSGSPLPRRAGGGRALCCSNSAASGPGFSRPTAISRGARTHSSAAAPSGRLAAPSPADSRPPHRSERHSRPGFRLEQLDDHVAAIDQHPVIRGLDRIRRSLSRTFSSASSR